MRPQAYAIFQSEDPFRKRKRFLGGSGFVPQKHRKPGGKKPVKVLLRIDEHEPLSIVFHCRRGIRFLQKKPIEELLFRVRALEKTAHGNIRIRKHHKHMTRRRDRFERFDRNIRVDKDRSALRAKLRQHP